MSFNFDDIITEYTNSIFLLKNNPQNLQKYTPYLIQSTTLLKNFFLSPEFSLPESSYYLSQLLETNTLQTLVLCLLHYNDMSKLEKLLKLISSFTSALSAPFAILLSAAASPLKKQKESKKLNKIFSSLAPIQESLLSLLLLKNKEHMDLLSLLTMMINLYQTPLTIKVSSYRALNQLILILPSLPSIISRNEESLRTAILLPPFVEKIPAELLLVKAQVKKRGRPSSLNSNSIDININSGNYGGEKNSMGFIARDLAREISSSKPSPSGSRLCLAAFRHYLETLRVFASSTSTTPTSTYTSTATDEGEREGKELFFECFERLGIRKLLLLVLEKSKDALSNFECFEILSRLYIHQGKHLEPEVLAVVHSQLRSLLDSPADLPERNEAIRSAFNLIRVHVFRNIKNQIDLTSDGIFEIVHKLLIEKDNIEANFIALGAVLDFMFFHTDVNRDKEDDTTLMFLDGMNILSVSFDLFCRSFSTHSSPNYNSSSKYSSSDKDSRGRGSVEAFRLITHLVCIRLPEDARDKFLDWFSEGVGSQRLSEFFSVISAASMEVQQEVVDAMFSFFNCAGVRGDGNFMRAASIVLCNNGAVECLLKTLSSISASEVEDKEGNRRRRAGIALEVLKTLIVLSEQGRKRFHEVGGNGVIMGMAGRGYEDGIVLLVVEIVLLGCYEDETVLRFFEELKKSHGELLSKV